LLSIEAEEMRQSRDGRLTCVVLAGGRSLRLGRDKALEELGGESLLRRIVRRLIPLATEIIVVGALNMEPHRLPTPAGTEIRTVGDVYEGRGVLAGIHAGLSAARSFHSAVVACDMPFVNVTLLRRLVDFCGPHDVVIPRHGDLIEPLHAVYSKKCLGPIETALNRGESRIVSFFPEVDVRYVEEAEVEQFSGQPLSFFNINTREDLERARQLLDARPAEDGPEGRAREP